MLGLSFFSLNCAINNYSPKSANINYEKYHNFDKISYLNSPFDDLIKSTYSSSTNTNSNLSESKHFIKILNTGEDALISRIHLIQTAMKSIHIQTFIWKNDESGRYVINELIKAAKRGVKIKIIIDQLGSTDDITLLSYLADSSPNLELKFYNPSFDRINPNILQMAGDIAFNFKNLNQRMHNKILIMDDSIAITGGRNYQNDYFDLNRYRNFKDRDILVVGPIVKNITKSFADYWEFKGSVNAIDLTDIGKNIKEKRYEKDLPENSFAFNGLFSNVNKSSNNYAYIKQEYINKVFEIYNIELIVDDPGKNNEHGLKGGGEAFLALSQILSKIKKSIVVQTPYLIVDKIVMKGVSKKLKDIPNLDIMISTNSLAATDNIYAYSHSFKQRKKLMRDLRFRIFELKPIPNDIASMLPNYNVDLNNFPENKNNLVNQIIDELPFMQKKRFLCIHAKSFVIDDEISFIGSFNVDPRSFHLNTEIGLAIKDINVAKALKENILLDMKTGNSWVAGKHKKPPLISAFSGLIGSILDHFPIVNVWPYQYSTLYELEENKKEVSFYDKDFYNNYKLIGSFPEMGLSKKQIQLRLLNAFTSFAEPII